MTYNETYTADDIPKAIFDGGVNFTIAFFSFVILIVLALMLRLIYKIYQIINNFNNKS